MIQDNIRNFCIIAHIDHGKSTLADRLLELTKTVQPQKMTEQFLDSMELEKEKGITIKLKPVRMEYEINNKKYFLNLVDTPGHVDFFYEVSRSLAAVEGAILLVDATQGIQAQTLANIELAKKQNLILIPVVNKIDMSTARVQESVQELSRLLEVAPEEIIKISAKNGTNVEKVLKVVIERIPSPASKNPNAFQKPFRALIFDSVYDSFKGVTAFVRVVDGSIFDKEKVKLLAGKTKTEIKELGYFNPTMLPQEKISFGEIGYIATGIKEPGKVRVGDTIVKLADIESFSIPPLEGYSEPNPVVFASFYPEDPNNFDQLKIALEKLKLQDPALVYEPEMKEFLGRGFRCGFLGTLHIEIVSQRLEREFNLSLIISTPSVIYKIKNKNGKEQIIYSASDWPNSSEIENIQEPWVLLEIISPLNYMGKLIEALKDIRGNYLKTTYLSAERAVIFYEVPLRTVVANVYDKIKSVSRGYASMNYKMLDYKLGKLKKMEIWIAGKPEEALSRVVAEENVYPEGKKIVEKLKEILPPQQFSVALQAVVDGRVIARETISARRKDVTGYLYGGDKSRKKKLLEKQKKGKKILKEKGQISIPSKSFLEMFRL